MPGTTRRHKPLRGRITFADLGIDTSGISDGDLLVYDSGSGLFEVTTVLSAPSYTFQGSILADSAAVTSTLSVGTNLTVTNDASIGGDLVVTDDLVADVATFAGLVLNGNGTVNGNLTVTGTLSAAGFSVSGDVTITGDLTVSDDLVVADDATIAGTLTVTDGINVNALLVTGNSVVNGNSLVLGTFNVTGVAGFGNGIVVDGNGAFSGQVVVGTNGMTVAEDHITAYDDFILTIGTQDVMSLQTIGLFESDGDPNGNIDALRGAIAIRSDAYNADSVLYVHTQDGTEGWVPLTDQRSNVEWLFIQIQLIKDALMDVVTSSGSVGIVIEGDG